MLAVPIAATIQVIVKEFWHSSPAPKPVLPSSSEPKKTTGE
jgi:hypothetical protein